MKISKTFKFNLMSFKKIYIFKNTCFRESTKYSRTSPGYISISFLMWGVEKKE